MGGSDGVAAHVLELRQLMPESRFVHRRSQRTQIVMVADPLKLSGAAIQQKSAPGDESGLADAEDCLIAVHFPPPENHTGDGLVQGRRLRRPQAGRGNGKLLYRLRPGHHGGKRGRHGPAWIEDFCFQQRAVSLFDSSLQPHQGPVFLYIWRRHIGSPDRHMDLIRKNQMDIPVQSRAWIPAGGLGKILQPDPEFVYARVHKRSDVHMERVVTVRPVTDFFSVHGHARLAHGPVEDQRRPFSGRNVQFAPIPADAHPGKAAGAPGLKRCLVFHVLRHGHVLKVVLAVEGAIDGPVVRDGHFFPAGRSVSLMEFPPRIQQHFAPLSKEGYRQKKQEAEDLSHRKSSLRSLSPTRMWNSPGSTK